MEWEVRYHSGSLQLAADMAVEVKEDVQTSFSVLDKFKVLEIDKALMTKEVIRRNSWKEFYEPFHNVQ